VETASFNEVWLNAAVRFIRELDILVELKVPALTKNWFFFKGGFFASSTRLVFGVVSWHTLEIDL
jgi:hypothetical protein